MTALTAIAMNELDVPARQRQAHPITSKVSSVTVIRHKAAPSLQSKDATESTEMTQPQLRKVFPVAKRPSPQQRRDEHRRRIAAGLRMALQSGQFTKQEICIAASIDRKTLDNWLNGYCDPTSWRIGAVSDLIGPWFFLHVYGGDIGLALFKRRQERIAAASNMEADLAEISAELERDFGF